MSSAPSTSDNPSGSGRPRGVLSRIGAVALEVAGYFVLLEPIWMLLPFAGFLYGSVLRIDSLARRPSTAFLTHFVFPVLAFGYLGPILVLVGLVLFLAGAGQIYWARIRRTGLVTKGLYRFVRHPQYVALTLFALGILLTWGRAITFLACFAMMFLYYYLAKSEERSCRRRFGDEYERYRERTSFLFPGDRFLRPLGARLPRILLPAPLRVTAALVLTMVACYGLLRLIDAVKKAVRTVPYLTATVPFGPRAASASGPAMTAGESAGIPFVEAGRVAVVRGPYRNAVLPGFAERVLLRLRASAALKDFLAFLDEPAGDVAILFCSPHEASTRPEIPGRPAGNDGSERRGPPPDPAGPDRVRLIILRCSLAPGADISGAFADKSRRTIRGACLAPVDLARPEGEDIVDGPVVRPGPGFPGEARWDFLLAQLAASRSAAPPPLLVPGQAESATLLLVQAPILRTRIDPAFAREILDRLLESPGFCGRLRDFGAGGEVVAVAFPRPGPNWYREHHGASQVSVFVILARPRGGPVANALFESGNRDLLAAFTAEMDFGIARPADSVGEIETIGPRRDLEERWEFFLSGVGGGSVRSIR